MSIVLIYRLLVWAATIKTGQAAERAADRSPGITLRSNGSQVISDPPIGQILGLEFVKDLYSFAIIDYTIGWINEKSMTYIAKYSVKVFYTSSSIWEVSRAAHFSCRR
jgi:hypothetical protein